GVSLKSFNASCGDKGLFSGTAFLGASAADFSEGSARNKKIRKRKSTIHLIFDFMAFLVLIIILWRAGCVSDWSMTRHRRRFPPVANAPGSPQTPIECTTTACHLRIEKGQS